MPLPEISSKKILFQISILKQRQGMYDKQEFIRKQLLLRISESVYSPESHPLQYR